MSKVIEFPNNKKVNNLRLFSVSSSNKRRYRLIKKLLPFFVVTPIYLGVMHNCGYSIERGNIMKKYSFSYDIEPSVKKGITYTGKWNKDDNGYSRDVTYYDVSIFTDSEIRNILVNKDIDSLKYSVIKSEIEKKDDIFLEEKLFNNSTIDCVSYDFGKANCYGNVGLSDVFYSMLGYFVILGNVYFSTDFLSRALSNVLNTKKKGVAYSRKKANGS